MQLFALSGPAHVKAARKHADEIDPGFLFSLHEHMRVWRHSVMTHENAYFCLEEIFVAYKHQNQPLLTTYNFLSEDCLLIKTHLLVFTIFDKRVALCASKSTLTLLL